MNLSTYRNILTIIGCLLVLIGILISNASEFNSANDIMGIILSNVGMGMCVSVALSFTLKYYDE